MSHATLDRRPSARRRRRLAVEALEHRLQPSAGLTDFLTPTDVAPAATVAGPLPLTIVDVPTYPGPAQSGTTRAVVAAPVASASVVIGAAQSELYLVAFDVPERAAPVSDRLVTTGTVISAAPSAPARQVVATSAGITVTGDSVVVATDNAVVRVDAMTGAVLATYATGLANDGVAVAPDGSVYVADYVANRVRHYSPTGAPLGSFSTSGTTPQGLTFGPDGNVYVTTTSSTVERFSPTGSNHTTFIAAGSGGLNNAKGIAWGPDGNAYVTSYFNSKVIRYDGATGAFIDVFAAGSGGFEDLTFGPDGNLYVASYGDGAVYRYRGTDGSPLGAFAAGIPTAYGLRFDPAGDLVVSSRSTGRLRRYDGATGAFLGNLATGLANPAYVVDTPSLVTTSAGGAATFRVALDARPTADVTVTLTSSAPGQGTLSRTTLTFTPADWDVPQAVRVTGLDDGAANGDRAYRIDGTAASSDPAYSGTGLPQIAVLNREIVVPNRPPVATGEAYTTAEDVPLLVAAPGVLGNDTDPDGDTLTVVVTALPGHGTLVLIPGGGFTYTPDADWSGTDSFTYHATDGSRNSAAVTASLVVTPVDDPPTLDPLPDLTIAEDSGTITLNLQGIGAGGGERQPLTVSAGRSDAAVLTQPTGYFYPLTGAGVLNLRPVPDANGTATVTLVVDDGTSTVTRTFTVTVTPVNDAPTAADDGFVTTQNTPLTVSVSGVLGNDRDIDGDTLAAVLVAGPANGTLTLSADGSFTYTPGPAFTGTDRFTYRASDGQAASSLATVVLRVLPASGRPVAEDDDYTVVAGGTLTVPASGVLANDTPSGNGALTAVLNSGPSHGTLTFNADGSFTYSPDAGYTGTDSFGYKATDGGGMTGTSRVRILVHRANRAPSGGADAVATVTGHSVVLSAAVALANDTDPDGDPITAELVSGAANGTVTTTADGSFTYTPDPGFSGTDTFTYRVTDGQLASGLVQVTVTVANPPTTTTTPAPTASPAPTTHASPTAGPGPTGFTPPTASTPPIVAAGPTASAAPTVSIAPSASGSYDGYGPSGGGPAGMISPVPAVSSGGSTATPRTNDTPATTDAGRVYSTNDAPAAPAPPAPAPQPAPVPQPQPAPAPSEPSAPPPAVVALPPATPAAPPLAFAPAVTIPATNAALPDSLLAPLDRIRDELRTEAAERATTDTIVVAGSVAVAGTVLLNTRAVYWFLSALLARPAVWRRFDPLDVVFAWERDGGRARAAGPDDSLQSMVG